MSTISPVLAKYVIKDREKKPFGIDGRIRLSYFLDLLSASHNESDLLLLCEDFSEKIVTMVNLKGVSGIVCPKYGNTLFGRAIAKTLEMKSGFVRGPVEELTNLTS